jgi:hypothetical protein
MNKKIIATLAAFLLLLLFLVVVKRSRAAKHNATPQPQKQSGGVAQPAATTPQAKPATPAIHASFRPLNLALLSGGFTSVDEFQQRAGNDPTLHSFYGSCSDTQAGMQQLPNDILVFATFRRGEDIKWTRKQMLVRKGEYVLTFCGKTVLARCGNLISWAPMQPSEDLPPSLLAIPTDELKDPQALALTAQADPAAESFGGLPPVAAAVSGHHSFFIPPFYIPSGGSSGHSAAPAALLAGDEFSGHQALTTLLLGLFAIAILKLVTR